MRNLVGIAFFFVIAITGIQVFSRYVLNRSLVWSEETVRFLVVWMCMVAKCPFATRRKTCLFLVRILYISAMVLPPVVIF